MTSLNDLPMTQFDNPDPLVISLITGAPGTNTLNKGIEIFKKATEHRLNHTGNGALFQYGPEFGFHAYVTELQKFLQESYGSPVNRDHLFLTTGASTGLFLVGSLFLPIGNGIVFAENPTYFFGLDLLAKDLGHKTISVGMCPDGVDVEEFEKVVKREYEKRDISKIGDRFWAMFYTVPTYHNPTGGITSPEKCKEIVRIARKYDILVMCDDVYNLLHYGSGYPPQRLFAFDDPKDSDYKGNVISNGSFSKILVPGMRVGWIEAAPRLRNRLINSGISNSSGSLCNYTSGLVASALSLGLEQAHLADLKKLLGERMTFIGEQLKKQLPQGFTVRVPQGGYFIWIEGPENFNSTEFASYLLEKRKIKFLAGNNCSSRRFDKTREGKNNYKDLCLNALRISIAHHDLDVLKKNVDIMCEEIIKFLS